MVKIAKQLRRWWGRPATIPSIRFPLAICITAALVGFYHYSATPLPDIFPHLQLQPAGKPSDAAFGFEEYLAALALLLIVHSISDFKYKFRLSLTRFNAIRITFIVSFSIGFLLLLADTWFSNGWQIPAALNSYNNIRLGLALIFLTMICYLYYIAFVSPPIFKRSNARACYHTIHYWVARGNPDHLATVSEWVGDSAGSIIRYAAGRTADSYSRGGDRPISHQDFAAYTLLILGSHKLCREMVEKSSWSVGQIFHEAAKEHKSALPLTPFSRNIGTELVLNPNSPLYTEDDGYISGLLGYTKPITSTIYGHFGLVEGLASKNGSPLDLRLGTARELNSDQVKAYTRAALIFIEAYCARGLEHHSVAFACALSEIESSARGMSRLTNMGDDFWKSDEYNRLHAVMDFVKSTLALFAAQPTPNRARIGRPRDHRRRNAHVRLAGLIFNVVKEVSYVDKPVWTSWSIQHNAVWSDLRVLRESEAGKLIQFYLRRMMYDQIRKLGSMPDFVAARITGYCLHVMGVSEEKGGLAERDGFGPLRRAAISWAKKNYLKLDREYPAVAEACLMGGISFDRATKRLVKSYAPILGKEPEKDYLALED